jgi:hypothetical protein
LQTEVTEPHTLLDARYQPNLQRIIKIVADSRFRENSMRMINFMSRSREMQSDPGQLFQLQAEMASELLHLQSSEREFRNTAAANPSKEERFELELAADVCRALAHTIKIIGDGIAWRALDFDRPLLHEIAFAPHAGHSSRETLIVETRSAGEHLVETGEYVILTAITNCLRYGDFISVAADSIGIHEVKAGKGSAGSGRATRQRRRTRDLVEFLRRGARATESGIYKLARLKCKPVSHLSAAADVCRSARGVGSAYARLSDALAVEAVDIQIMADRFEAGGWRLSDPFKQSPHAGAMHSLNNFGRFSPNIAPYSVYPLDDQDRVGAMSGGLWLISYINQGNVVRCLRRRGLWVRVPTEQELREGPTGLKPGEIARHELDNPIAISNGSATLLVSLGEIGRLAYEFIDEESFADMVQEHLSRPPEPALFYAAFEDEAELWD